MGGAYDGLRYGLGTSEEWNKVKQRCSGLVLILREFESIKNPIKIQNLVFLLAQYGLSLDYSFNNNGLPFSQKLHEDLTDIFDSDKKFYQRKTNELFLLEGPKQIIQDFKKTFGNKLENSAELDMLSKVLFLHRYHSEKYKTPEQIADAAIKNLSKAVMRENNLTKEQYREKLIQAAEFIQDVPEYQRK